MSAEHTHRGAAIDNPHARHDDSDVDIRSIVGFAIALVVVAAVLHVAVWLLFRFYAAEQPIARRDYPVAVPQRQEMPALPRLQTNPRQDMRDLRAQEDSVLGTYGWADRNAGSVRIPIEQAMKLTLERGLPARVAPAPPAATSSGDANSGRFVGALGAGK